MFKELVDYIYKNDGQVSKHTVLRLLYYTIKMKNGSFGFDIFYTDLFSKDDVLKLNLYVSYVIFCLEKKKLYVKPHSFACEIKGHVAFEAKQ
jgi:hypothetical protein